MNSDLARTEHSTYDLGSFFSDVGGLFKALDLFFTILVAFLGSFRMWSLFANLLYKDDDNNDLIVQNYFTPSLKTGKIEKNEKLV